MGHKNIQLIILVGNVLGRNEKALPFNLTACLNLNYEAVEPE